jgi:hypothetical protein
MPLQWVDTEWSSVVNLDGSDPLKSEHMSAVPRLVVFLRQGTDNWGTYCITTNGSVPEMHPDWPTREDAKKAVVDFARKALPERWKPAIEQLSR